MAIHSNMTEGSSKTGLIVGKKILIVSKQKRNSTAQIPEASAQDTSSQAVEQTETTVLRIKP